MKLSQLRLLKEEDGQLTALESHHDVVKRFNVTHALHKLAIPFSWFEEDAVHNIAIVFSNRNERYVFLAAPSWHAEDEGSIVGWDVWESAE